MSNRYNLIQKKLTKSLSPEEDKKLVKWLAESKVNQREYDQLYHVWSILNSTTEHEFDPKTARQQFWNKVHSLPKGRFIFSRATLYKMAASFALLLICGWLLYTRFSTTVISAKTALTEAMLPDGTQIWLQKGSELTYPYNYNKENRQVRLNGLVYFDVKRNVKKPFIVIHDEGKVEVLGTSFEVRSYPEDPLTEISVTTGRVAVEMGKNKEKVILTPGEKVIYLKSQDDLSLTSTSPNEIAWKSGYLQFSNTPIEEALKDLSEYFQLEFTITSKTDCSLTTSFQQPELENVIEELEFLLNTEIQIKDNKVIIHKIYCK